VRLLILFTICTNAILVFLSVRNFMSLLVESFFSLCTLILVGFATERTATPKKLNIVMNIFLGLSSVSFANVWNVELRYGEWGAYIIVTYMISLVLTIEIARRRGWLLWGRKL
jgi:hypothetical protein